PLAQPLVRRARDELLGRGAEPFDAYELAHSIGVDAGVLQDDGAAQRVADQVDRKPPDDVGQGRKVQDVLRDRVHSARRPTAVAVAAEVGRDHPEIAAEGGGDAVPTAGAVPAAVRQAEVGPAVVAPGPEEELESGG